MNKFAMSMMVAGSTAFFHNEEGMKPYKELWGQAEGFLDKMVAEKEAEIAKGPEYFEKMPAYEPLQEGYDALVQNAQETYDIVVPQLKKSVKAFDKIQSQVRNSRAFKRLQKRKREMKQLMKQSKKKAMGIIVNAVQQGHQAHMEAMKPKLAKKQEAMQQLGGLFKKGMELKMDSMKAMKKAAAQEAGLDLEQMENQ